MQIGKLTSLLGQTRVYMYNGGHLVKWVPCWNSKWLLNSKTWFQQPLKHANRCQDRSNRPTEFNAMTKTEFTYRMTRSQLEKKMGAILNFQMANWEYFIRNINLTPTSDCLYLAQDLHLPNLNHHIRNFTHFSSKDNRVIKVSLHHIKYNHTSYPVVYSTKVLRN